MIEIITGKDVQDMYFVTEHGTFTPIYEYEHYDQETDSYVGFNVIKTAEEVYNEWLDNKDRPPIVEPDKMEVLTTRVDGLENINAGLLLENAEHQIKIKEQEKMNKEQEVTNANLLLEIAMLKGAML